MDPSFKHKRILVTGAHGMLGTAVVDHLKQMGCEDIVTPVSKYDLRERGIVQFLLAQHKPDYVIHLAAKVGGLKANMDNNGAFFSDNIKINANVLEQCKVHDVEKVISILSTCIYPKAEFVKYPLTEEQLELGPPHESNFGYAYAKRMLYFQSKAYNQDPSCDTQFVCATPNNLFGAKDNFDLQTSHVVPAVIRKVYEYAIDNDNIPKFWGRPDTLREFTHSSDAARAIVFLLQNERVTEGNYNIGTTEQTPILDLIRTVKYVSRNQQMPIIFEDGTPVGQKMKPSSNKKFLDCYYDVHGKDFVYKPLEETLKETYEWYKDSMSE